MSMDENANVDIEWVDAPPEKKLSRAEKIEIQLRANPGKWAKIYSGPVFLHSIWWTRFDNEDFEMRIILENPDVSFGRKSVYARFISKEDNTIS